MVQEQVTDYRVSHSNVDGAGHIGYFPSKEAAIAEAKRLQADSDSRGNVWGYRYHVWVGGRKAFSSTGKAG